MQKAVISSCIFPNLLEKVFERFNSSNLADRRDTEYFLLDLHKLLGRRLVPAALHILDHQTIIVYTSNPKTIEIAEICNVRDSFGLMRLFLHINYCTCEYFKENVLMKNSCTASYTCQHVLAIRLAIALQHKCLQYKEVQSNILDLLLDSFIPTNSEVD